MRHETRADREDEIEADYDVIMGADAEDADHIGAEIAELYGMDPMSQQFGAKLEQIAKRLGKLKGKLEKLTDRGPPRGPLRRIRTMLYRRRMNRLSRRIEKLQAKYEEAGGGEVDEDYDEEEDFYGYGARGNYTPRSAHPQIARLPTIGGDHRDRLLHNNPHHRPGAGAGTVHGWGGQANRDARDRQIHRGLRWR